MFLPHLPHHFLKLLVELVRLLQHLPGFVLSISSFDSLSCFPSSLRTTSWSCRISTFSLWEGASTNNDPPRVRGVWKVLMLLVSFHQHELVDLGVLHVSKCVCDIQS